ncbi:MAG: cytochrome P450 [Deltaproteobacteria bacterium]|nr:cytochrome P450 [Deltaproteobacteria bacterium]MBW2445017.1 cytochrome P450 [Deltaproteobacteria bacterium]
MSELRPFRSNDPDWLEDPYPHYREYREREPVHWGASAAPALDGQWWFFRHEDVSALLADPRVGRDWRRMREIMGAKPIPESAAPLAEMLDRWMIQREGAEHARLRRITGRAFRPRTVARLRPRVEEVAAERLSRIPDGEPFDLVARYARPFSVRIMSELLGVPREDQRRVGGWIRGLGKAFGGDSARAEASDAGQAAFELAAYLSGLLDERLREPREDLLSDLVAEGVEGRFARAEAVATCMLLIGAGYSTVVHFLANATHALLRAPEVLSTLQAEPVRFEASVDELIRFDGPTQTGVRYTTEPISMGGEMIEAGSLIGLVIGSANRDPAAFDEPDRIDLDRDARHHLGFGRGPHYCLGSALARLEGGIGLRALFERFPGLALGEEPPRWGDLVGRGIGRLQVSG